MFLVSSRVLRVFGLVAAVIAFGLPSALVAGPIQARIQIDLADGAREPFGFATLLPAGGGVLEKWLAVWRQWNDEKQVLIGCREDRTTCADPAVLEFLAIVDNAKALKGRAQLGDINRSINLAIKPRSDLAAHGSIDVWSSPLATLTSRSGDCEDYAILKFAALLEAGVSSEDLRLLIVRDSVRSEDHAIVGVRLEGQWLVLDNRRLIMLADAQLANYAPMLLLDSRGARRYADVSHASVEQDSSTSVSEPSGDPSAVMSAASVAPNG